MKQNITFGDKTIQIEISNDFLTTDHPYIAPREIELTPNMADICGTIKTALGNPFNSPKLKDIVCDKIVALVVSDEFRAGQHEFIIKCLLEEISAGSPKSVNVLCATGTHNPDIYSPKIKSWVEKYASEIGLNINFYANDCTSNNFIHLGNTKLNTPIEVNKYYLEADVRVYGHESKHHYMCGYSCIDKQLLPGISSRRTVEANHKLALQSDLSRAGRSTWANDKSRQENPFSNDCSEARQIAEGFILINDELIKRDVVVFGLDMISDKKAVYWCEAGDTREISRHMTKEADKLAAFFCEPTKYVVISPGGPPASTAIYGVQNCFDMALSGAIQDAGEALVIAPCEGRDGVACDVKGLAPDEKSKALFWDNLCNLCNVDVNEATKWIGNNFELYLWKTDRVLKLINGRKVKIYLHSTLPDETIKAAGFIPCHDIDKWISERQNRNDGKCRIIDQGNKILVMSKANH